MGNGPSSGGLETDELKVLTSFGIVGDALLEALTGPGLLPRWGATVSRAEDEPPASGAEFVAWLSTRIGREVLMRPAFERGWLTPTVTGIAAAAVTSIAIGVPAPWRDEQATAAAASRTWPQLVELVTGSTDAVNAVYYALMQLWVGLVGVDPFWLRLPSAIAVGVAAAGVVVLGRQLDRTRTGLIAAVLLVLLPRVFWAGGEARSYALQIAAAVWLTVLFMLRGPVGAVVGLDLLRRRDGRRQLAVPLPGPAGRRAAADAGDRAAVEATPACRPSWRSGLRRWRRCRSPFSGTASASRSRGCRARASARSAR